MLLQTQNLNRRSFIHLSALHTWGLAIIPGSFYQQNKPPALKPELVKEFVGAAHSKFDKTQELLLQEPGLLNATWDWGGGDFETGLGGASHMGNREIATFLLSKGARMDIFAAAMLGKLEIIQTTLQIFPDMISCKGAHGISLLKHAKAGGKEAEAVVAFLETQGGK